MTAQISVAGREVVSVRFDRAQLSRLNEDIRGRLIYQISEMRNRGVSSEERQKAFADKVDRALQTRR